MVTPYPQFMNNVTSYTPSTDRVLAGVVLMLGFCVTAPLLDVAAKLASESVPVGQITATRFIVQCALMAPFVWIMGLSLRVAREHWLALFVRASLLLASTFCFIGNGGAKIGHGSGGIVSLRAE